MLILERLNVVKKVDEKDTKTIEALKNLGYVEVDEHKKKIEAWKESAYLEAEGKEKKKKTSKRKGKVADGAGTESEDEE